MILSSTDRVDYLFNDYNGKKTGILSARGSDARENDEPTKVACLLSFPPEAATQGNLILISQLGASILSGGEFR
jgi:hypothetical protein